MPRFPQRDKKLVCQYVILRQVARQDPLLKKCPQTVDNSKGVNKNPGTDAKSGETA